MPPRPLDLSTTSKRWGKNKPVLKASGVAALLSEVVASTGLCDLTKNSARIHELYERANGCEGKGVEIFGG